MTNEVRNFLNGKTGSTLPLVTIDFEDQNTLISQMNSQPALQYTHEHSGNEKLPSSCNYALNITMYVCVFIHLVHRFIVALKVKP